MHAAILPACSKNYSLPGSVFAEFAAIAAATAVLLLLMLHLLLVCAVAAVVRLLLLLLLPLLLFSGQRTSTEHDCHTQCSQRISHIARSNLLQHKCMGAVAWDCSLPAHSLLCNAHQQQITLGAVIKIHAWCWR